MSLKVSNIVVVVVAVVLSIFISMFTGLMAIELPWIFKYPVTGFELVPPVTCL